MASKRPSFRAEMLEVLSLCPPLPKREAPLSSHDASRVTAMKLSQRTPPFGYVTGGGALFLQGIGKF
jgi:hypothetical protein